MKKSILLFVFVLLVGPEVFSRKTIRIYEGKAPGSEDWNYREIEYINPMNKGLMVRNVVDPTLEVFIPDKAVTSDTSVIVCPGGGNVWLSYSIEGTDVAKWFAAKGITAVVLKHRLIKTLYDWMKASGF